MLFQIHMPFFITRNTKGDILQTVLIFLVNAITMNGETFSSFKIRIIDADYTTCAQYSNINAVIH